jgi:hypothetical protein
MSPVHYNKVSPSHRSNGVKECISPHMIKQPIKPRESTPTPIISDKTNYWRYANNEHSTNKNFSNDIFRSGHYK